MLTVQDSENPGAGTISLVNDDDTESVTTLGMPARVAQMIDRVWQYNETGDVGEAVFVFNIADVSGVLGEQATDFALIISDTANLSGESVRILVASGYEASTGNVFFRGVDLQDGQYITLATKTAPDNFSLNPNPSGLEDEAIDLGFVLGPALTDGGPLRDVIGSAIGYRPSDAGATPTVFDIPAGTTGIRITGFSTLNTNSGANDALNDDFQSLFVSVDLKKGVSSGSVAYLIDQGPSRSDQYSWSDAELGVGIGDGSGAIVGDFSGASDPIFEVIDGQLHITENHGLQSAYQVEFLTAETTSAVFLQTSSEVREQNDTAPAVFDIPADADFITINITDAAAGSDAAVEYKGLGRITINLTDLTASGVLFAQRGETDARTITYAFEDYDVSSDAVGSVQSGGATVLGDITDSANANSDPQIYINDQGQLVVERDSGFASVFNTLYTVEFFDRLDVGSPADGLGASADYQRFDSGTSLPTSTLTFEVPEGAVTGIFNLSMNGTATSDTNENMGGGFAVIDLASGTTSGSMYNVRASSVVDFVSWQSVGLGDVMFDHADTISNHANVSNFNDRFIATASFNLTDNADGSQTLTMDVTGSTSNATHMDYWASAQIQWLGPQPIDIADVPSGGSFDVGALNPETGNWQITLEDAINGISYVPDANHSGVDVVEFGLSLGPEYETSVVRIAAVLDPLSFETDTVTGNEDADISIFAAITPTFVDQDGSETLTSMTLTGLTEGHTISDGASSFTASATQTSVDVTGWDHANMVYRAPQDVAGTFTVGVSVDYQDVGGGVIDTGSASETFDVIVQQVNDVPVATNESYAGLRDADIVATAANGVLANDADADGDSLSVATTPVSGPTNGAITVNADNSITYTPDADFFGVDSFTYTVTDAENRTDTATVTVTVSNVQDVPVANSDSQGTIEDVPLTSINVLGNDFDVDGDPLAITGAVADLGTVTINADNTLSYTPLPNYNGSDTITYSIADGNGGTATATVLINISPVQDAPVTIDRTVTVAEDQAHVFDLSEFQFDDPDVGDVFSAIRIDTLPLEGTLLLQGLAVTAGQVIAPAEVDAARLIFQPDANENGDAYAAFQFSVSDGADYSTSATMTINVTPAADVPIGSDDAATTDEDTAVSGSVHTNDVDADNDTLFVSAVNGNSALVGGPVVLASGAQLVMSADGTYTYDPNGAFENLGDSGSATDSFTYEINDGNGGTDTATVTIAITGVDDVLAFTDTDDDPMAGADSVVSEAGLPAGSEAATDAGSVQSTFTIQVGDGQASLTVAGQSITPSELQGSAATPVAVPTTNGTLEIRGYDATSGQVSYRFTLTNSVDHSAGDVIEGIALSMADHDGDVTSATLGVLILNDTPIANADPDETVNASGNPNSIGYGNVVTGVDLVGDGNTLDGVVDALGANTPSSAAVVTGVVAGTGSPAGTGASLGTPVAGQYGTLTLNADGSYAYTPDYTNPTVVALRPQDSLPDVFTYEITDAEGQSSSTTLKVSVIGVPAVVGLSDGAVTATDGTVLEADIATGSNAVGMAETLSGSFFAVAPKGIEDLTIGATVLTLSDLENSDTMPISPIVMSFGTLTVTGFDGDTGEVFYTYTVDTASADTAGDEVDSIAVAVRDTDLDQGVGALSIAIVDDTPTAQADTGAASEDGVLVSTGNVVADGGTGDTIGADDNAAPVTDVVAGTNTATGAGGVGAAIAGTYGSLVLQSDGSYTYTLDNASGAVQSLSAGEVVNDIFIYAIADGDGDQSEATLTIAVTGANDAPTAGDISLATDEDAAVGGVVVASDIDGDDLVTTLDTGATNGTVVVQTDGTFTYTPDADYNGTDSFLIEVADPHGGTATIAVTVTVAALDDAADDALAILEDMVGSGEVATNDSYAGDVSYSLGDGPVSGTVVMQANGTYTYTPDADFYGDDRFTYIATDAYGGQETQTVQLTVDSLNDAPVNTAPLSVTTNEDVAIAFTGTNALSVTDVDGNLETVRLTSLSGSINVDLSGGAEIASGENGSQNLTLSGSNAQINAALGTVTFLGDPNFFGVSILNIQSIDSAALPLFDADSIEITILDVNDAPVAAPDSIVIDEDTIAAGNLITDLAGADTDVDGDTLTVTGITVDLDGDGTNQFVAVGAPTVLMNVAGAEIGTLTVNSDGAYSFVASADYDGAVPHITYTISDGAGGSDSATLQIGITSVNDAPVLSGVPLADLAHDDGDTVIGVDVTGAFADIDADTLTYGAVGLPLGLAIDAATGLISGDIDSGASQNNPYTVIVTATDPDGQNVSDTFEWVISNPAPVVADDGTVNLTEDTPHIFDPRANDVDSDGDVIGVTAINGVSLTTPVLLGSGATVTLNDNGSITYTPGNNVIGADSFDYTITDADGATSTATVTLEVGGVNDAPTAIGALPTLSLEDAQTGIDVEIAAAFFDVDGDTLSYSVSGLPTALAIDPATGIISGSIGSSASQGGPLADGVYPYTVTATDPDGESVALTATMVITNLSPVAGTQDNAQVSDAAVVSIQTAGTFADPDGDTLVYTAAGLPTGLSINAETGEITGTMAIDASRSGPIPVTVSVDDGEGGSASETFVIVAVNPAPVVTPGTDQVDRDGNVVAYDASVSFVDPDGDDITYSASGLPTGLTIDVTNGLISGAVENSASQAAPYTIAVVATDADGAESTDTFVWNVDNPAPVLIDQIPNQAANDSDAYAFDVSPYFSDIDNDQLTFAASGLPAGVSIDPMTGEMSGTLPADASLGGPYVVAVTVDDGEGGTTTDTFVFTINNLNPGLLGQIANVQSHDGEEIAPFDISPNFSDPDGDPLAFSANGLPPGLSIDPVTGVITGTIDTHASQTGPYSVAITATDGTSEVIDAFTWAVENPAPTIVVVVPNQTHVDGAEIDVALGSFFVDPDSDGLTYAATGLPSGLSIDADTGRVTGSLFTDGSLESPYSVTLTVTDGDGDAVVTAFTWNIDNIPPEVVMDPSDLVSNDQDMVEVATAMWFADSDNDPITYTANGLPAGLSIDPQTGVISGTIGSSASQGGDYVVVVTATDNAGDSAATAFTWRVENPVPEAAEDTFVAIEDTPIVLDLLANDTDADNDPLIITAINDLAISVGQTVTLPSDGQVTLNADGTVTYTPASDANGMDQFTYTIADVDGAVSLASASIDVAPVNDAPRLVGEMGSQTNAETDNISVDVSGAFFEIDVQDPVTYSATGLPPGLSIDPGTGVISGSPNPGSAMSGPYTVTVTATDSQGAFVDVSFVWTLEAAGADISALVALATQGQEALTQGAAAGIAIDSTTGASPATSPIVLGAVNGVRPLDGMGDPAGRDRFERLMLSVGDRFGNISGYADIAGAEGFSSWSLANNGHTSFAIETFIRNRTLFVEISGAQWGDGDGQFTEFRATLADGRPLPEWIAFWHEGVMMIDQYTGEKGVMIKITGNVADGEAVTQFVTIDVATGAVSECDCAGSAVGPSFSAALEQLVESHQHEKAVVDQILARP